MTVFDLFSGIGGFSLGLERAGFTTQYFCEIDPYCRGVLAKHWPHVPCFEDVRTVRGVDLTPVDLLCGGFPCQDISLAGKGAGLSGERSGLWFEYARLIDEIRPRYVLIENVSALRSRGLDRVLGSLAALGYDAEWHCIPACAVGAPHRRDRVWIVAYTRCVGGDGWRGECGGPEAAGSCDRLARSSEHAVHVADAQRAERWPISEARHDHGTDSDAQREESTDRARSGGEDVADALRLWELQSQGIEQDQWGRSCDESWEGFPGEWEPEPDVGRVAHGVPARVDRLRGLGNAVVPQIAELLGYAILAHAESVRLTEVPA